jgi:hypothetical protein
MRTGTASPRAGGRLDELDEDAVGWRTPAESRGRK